MSEQNSGYSPFIPIAIMAVTYLLLASWQTTIAYSAKSLYSKQFEQQTDMIKETQKAKEDIEKFYSDLLEVSAKDSDVKAIVDRFKIQRIEPSKSK